MLQWNLQLLLCLILFSCGFPQKTPDYSRNIKTVAVSGIKEKEKMFERGESSEVLFDASKRSFYVNEIVQVRLKNETEMEIANYAAQEIRNVTVWIKLAGYDEFFSVIRFDKIPAFFRFSYPIPLVEEDGYYLTESGKRVEVFRVPVIPKDSASFKVSSDDPFYQKLTKIKAKWRITFGSYGTGENPGNWFVMKPVHAREWIILITNMAYLFSTSLFEEEFLNYEGLYGNDKILFDREDRKNILNKPHFQLGVVRNVSGLGGGAVLGVAEYVLIKQYISYGGLGVFVHELAHCLGYGHDSNMTYPGGGAGFSDSFIPDIHDFLNDRGFLPYCDYRLLNTYELYWEKDFYDKQNQHRPNYRIEKENPYEKRIPEGQELDLF